MKPGFDHCSKARQLPAPVPHLPTLLLVLAALLSLGGCDSDRPIGPRDGKTVYQTTCISCHSSGANGSPRVGDTHAWSQILLQDRETIFAAVKNGKGQMPEMGLCFDCTDDELRAAIEHMIESSQ